MAINISCVCEKMFDGNGSCFAETCWKIRRQIGRERLQISLAKIMIIDFLQIVTNSYVKTNTLVL